ncbi:MAG TPA: hypothetical protein VK607_10585 [Kofleriaceae bacterium]|nr:hypothetical protein [Kofleriaceae bacterium]
MSYSVKEAARTIVLSASNHPPDIAIIGCLVAAASIATHVGATRERLMSTLEAAFVLMQHEQHRRSS